MNANKKSDWGFKSQPYREYMKVYEMQEKENDSGRCRTRPSALKRGYGAKPTRKLKYELG
jgi:hypothetical protein